MREPPPPTLRDENVCLGILYMLGAVFLFSFQNGVGKWLAQSYSIAMLVFFRSAFALLPCYLLVLHAGGPAVLRTRRLGAQFGRANLNPSRCALGSNSTSLLSRWPSGRAKRKLPSGLA